MPENSIAVTEDTARTMQAEHTPGSDAVPGNDEKLFRRYLEGDDAAFMELFHRHTAHLFAYALKILGSREQAHDTLQDIWERMARFRAEGKESPGNIAGFLIRSVRNRCLNVKAKKRPEYSLEDLTERQHPKAENDRLTERQEIVIAALDQLPEEQKELLILHTYAGYSYEEIALMLDDSVGAVRTRAWRARVKLGRVITALIDMSNG